MQDDGMDDERLAQIEADHAAGYPFEAHAAYNQIGELLAEVRRLRTVIDDMRDDALARSERR